MKYKLSLCISALCLLTAFLLSMALRLESSEALASRLAPDILRFHVLADSDSPKDQQLKLEVRDLVMDYVQDLLGNEATKEETVRLVCAHKEEIEDLSQEYLRSQGKDCAVTLSLARDYFPTKAYGDLVFPCGTYDTVRLTIGSGRGHNWWCVLYPPLCYTDPVNAIVPAASKQRLKEEVGRQDYEALLPRNERSGEHEKEAGSQEVEVRFFLLDLLRGNLASS